MRNNLADALSRINYPMDELLISDTSSISMSQSQSSPASASSREREDKLSKSIHILFQRLKTLDIYSVIVSDEIFFPRTLSVDMAEPRWDRLVMFSLYYPPVNPSGEWLFLPNPNADKSEDLESEASLSNNDTSDSSSQESRPTRSIAAPAMQQFYLAAAHAALQMSALKHMTLVAQLEVGENWYKFCYYTKGLTAEALLTSSSGFIPEDEVLECWRKVQRKPTAVLN